MLLLAYYARNYAGIIGASLTPTNNINFQIAEIMVIIHALIYFMAKHKPLY